MIKMKATAMNFDGAVRRLTRLGKAVPGAVVTAINKTGFAVLDALTAEMPRSFDRPTPYTLRSLYVQKATASHLAATIRPKGDGYEGKGTPAAKYLGPEIFGGARNVKRSERALRIMGVLPVGMITVPGSGATFDAFGNQSVGEIRQILSFFKSAEMTMGYTANMTDKTRARLARGTKKRGFGYSYFVVKTRRRNLAPGIYRKMNFVSGHAIKPVLMFVDKASYSRRYRWHEVGNLVARQMFDRYLAKELADVK